VSDRNRGGLTVFLTTHNMSEADEMCSRVAIIDQGRIAAVDTPEVLRSTISSRQYVEVRFAGAAPEIDELASLGGVSQVDGDDRTFRLVTTSPGEVVTEVVRLADTNGLQITDLGNHQPSLEDVFLYITGGREEGDLR
jgi:ABC-2 type transport system ATP-binding protein